MADRNFKSKSQAGDWQSGDWLGDFGSQNGDLGSYSTFDRPGAAKPSPPKRDDWSGQTNGYEAEIIPPGTVGGPYADTRPTTNDEVEESETRIKFVGLDFAYRWRKTRKLGWE
jgi:hypothetical protein